MHKESARRVVGLVLRAGAAPPLSDAQLLNEFVRDRAAEAFAEIVRRHGSMVFSACRRVLGHEQDAEDAFQATFLVLARKAHAVRPMDSLGPWLYRVAFRTARRAKSRLHRESVRHANLAAQIQTVEAKPPESSDWLPLLDEELNRLSERERLPIVLCDLMGRSRKEAAAELKLSEGTLSSRLARGRDRLRSRLQRRGVVPAITAAGLVLEPCSAPAALVASTFNLATAVTTSSVVNLAEGVIRTMMIHSTVKLFAVFAGIMLFGGAGLMWGLSSANEAVEQKKDVPGVAYDSGKKEPSKKDDKTDGKNPKTKDDAPKAKKVDEVAEKAVAAKTRLLDLQKELVETLQEQVKVLEAVIGKEVPSPILIEAWEKLMGAQLALATDKKSRIQIMERHLQRMIDHENLWKQELKAKGGTRNVNAIGFATVKAKRLTAEILLEKEKQR